MKKKPRLSARVIAADRALMVTLQSLTDYAPRNATFSLEAIQHTEARLAQLELNERLVRQQLASIRDEIIEESYRYHDQLLGSKDEVIAQYGSDSPLLKAVGRKPKSEYKRRSAATPTT